VYPFGIKEPQELKEYEFTGIRPSQLNRLVTSEYRKYHNKLFVWQPVTFRDQTGWFLHKSLRAIGHNTLISKLHPGQYAEQNELIIPGSQLGKIYESYPGILHNTEKALKECVMSFDFSTVKNKKNFSQSAYDDKLLLEKLA